MLGAGLLVVLASCPEQPHIPWSKRVDCQAGGWGSPAGFGCVTLASHTFLSHQCPDSAAARSCPLASGTSWGPGRCLGLGELLQEVSLTRVCFRIQFVSVCFFHPHLPCCSAFDGLEASSNMKSRPRVPGAEMVSQLPSPLL